MSVNLAKAIANARKALEKTGKPNLQKALKDKMSERSKSGKGLGVHKTTGASSGNTSSSSSSSSSGSSASGYSEGSKRGSISRVADAELDKSFSQADADNVQQALANAYALAGEDDPNAKSDDADQGVQLDAAVAENLAKAKEKAESKALKKAEEKSYKKRLKEFRDSDWNMQQYLTDLFSGDNEAANAYLERQGIDKWDPYADLSQLVTDGGKKIWREVFTSTPEAEMAYIDAYGDQIDANADHHISDDEADAFYRLMKKTNDNLNATDYTDESVMNVYGGQSGDGLDDYLLDAMNQGLQTQPLVDELEKQIRADVSLDEAVAQLGGDLANSEGEQLLLSSGLAQAVYDKVKGNGESDAATLADAYDKALARYNNMYKLDQVLSTAYADDGRSLVDYGGTQQAADAMNSLLNNAAGGSSGLVIAADGDNGVTSDENPDMVLTDNDLKYLDTGLKQGYNTEITRQHDDLSDALSNLIGDGGVDSTLAYYLAKNLLAADDETLKKKGYRVYGQSGDWVGKTLSEDELGNVASDNSHPSNGATPTSSSGDLVADTLSLGNGGKSDGPITSEGVGSYNKNSQQQQLLDAWINGKADELWGGIAKAFGAGA